MKVKFSPDPSEQTILIEPETREEAEKLCRWNAREIWAEFRENSVPSKLGSSLSLVIED